MLEHGSHGGPKSGVLEHRLLAAHRSQAAGAPSARRPMIPPGVLELCSPPSAVRRAGAPYARRPMTNTRRPATTRQKAVQPACFLKRPRVFARSAGCQHRLHSEALATLREPHRLSTPPASPRGSSFLAAHPSLAAGAPPARRPTTNPAAGACSPPIQVLTKGPGLRLPLRAAFHDNSMPRPLLVRGMSCPPGPTLKWRMEDQNEQ